MIGWLLMCVVAGVHCLAVASGELVIVETPSEKQLYYEEPSMQKFSKPTGVLLAMHGCGHSARDFWTSSETCPGCYGLPIGLTTTKEALSRGYVFASFSSSGPNGCWSKYADLMALHEVMDLLRIKFPRLPLYLYGVSSGTHPPLPPSLATLIAHCVVANALSR